MAVTGWKIGLGQMVYMVGGGWRWVQCLAGSLSSLVAGKCLFETIIFEVNALAIKALDQTLALQKTKKKTQRTVRVYTIISI